LRPPTVSTKLAQIAKQSRENPKMVFTTLAHLMDVEFLMVAFRSLRKDAAVGIDKVTVAAYAANLEENLWELYQKLKTNRYRAQMVRRVWIDKADGSKRPLGILVLEDKIVQKAVSMILGAVYEPMFYDFSYGFRPGRSPHQALSKLREECCTKNIGWIVDADISGFFDSIDHNHLRTIIKRRVNDGALLRLIGKWLNVGVLEEGRITYNETGTPQGGVISPILANIFLHSILDNWFEQTARPRLLGKCFIVRFADDFVLGFEHQTDAERVYEAIQRRFKLFGLTIHPTKSKIIQFTNPFRNKGNNPETFDFLGFTHYWSKTRQGGWAIKRKTRKKSLNRAMRSIWVWCKYNRHKLIREQYQKLRIKLLGHYQYFGIRGNYKMLEVIFEHTEKTWKKWLGRRTRNGSISWEKFEKKYRTLFLLPKPRITRS